MAKLTPDKRDELLIRLDQKVQDSLPRIEKHLEKINGHLADHSKRILTIEVQRKVSKKSIVGYASVVVAVIVALWKAFVV